MIYHCGVPRNGKISWSVEFLDIEATFPFVGEHTTALRMIDQDPEAFFDMLHNVRCNTKLIVSPPNALQQFLECWLLSSLRTFCNFF